MLLFKVWYNYTSILWLVFIQHVFFFNLFYYFQPVCAIMLLVQISYIFFKSNLSIFIFELASLVHLH